MRIELEPEEAALLKREAIKRGVPPEAIPQFVEQWQVEFAFRALERLVPEGMVQSPNSSRSEFLLLETLVRESTHLDMLAERFVTGAPRKANPVRGRGSMRGRGGSVDAFLREKRELIAAGLE